MANDDDWPEASVQGILSTLDGTTWWTECGDNALRRGRLIRAFVPHVDQTPYELQVQGRDDPRNHGTFQAQVSSTSIRRTRPRGQLPVAAMPRVEGEVFTVHRAKIRPCLILSCERPQIPRALTRATAGWMTAPTLLVAPYYGVDHSGRRGGWQGDFVARIQLAEYPMYLWDRLPLGGRTTESILRLDHIQPVGAHYNSWELTDWCLTEDAMVVVDEWIDWLRYGSIDEDSVLLSVRQLLLGE